MTRAQILVLFTSGLVLLVAVYALCILTPGQPWYTVVCAGLASLFNVLVMGKLLGWLK